LDDHIAPVIKSSTDGYLSHAKYIVRLGSLDGVVPPAEHCVEKGMIVNKPFTAYFMLYTDDEGYTKVSEELAEWNRMVEEYTPEKLKMSEQDAPQEGNTQNDVVQNQESQEQQVPEVVLAENQDFIPEKAEIDEPVLVEDYEVIQKQQQQEMVEQQQKMVEQQQEMIEQQQQQQQLQQQQQQQE
jgi:hypothetical protein